MLDSSNDSSLTESTNSSANSTKNTIEIRKELRHINDVTNAVMKENTQLRAQFEQATSANEKVDDINKKNIILVNQLRKLQNVNDELRQRLEISLNSKLDNDKKIEEEKFNIQKQIQTERERNSAEIKKIEKGHKLQIDHLYGEIEKIKNYSNDVVIGKKVLENQIEKVLNAASHYFSYKINSIDDLISCFDQYISQPENANQYQVNNQNQYQYQYPYQYQSEQQFPIAQDDNANAMAVKNLKKSKIKIKKLNDELSKLKEDLLQAEHKNDKLANSEKLLSQDYERKIQCIKDDYEMKIFDQTKEIERLNKKLGSLDNELVKKKKQLKKITEELENKRNEPLVVKSSAYVLPNQQNAQPKTYKPPSEQPQSQTSANTKNFESLNNELNLRVEEMRSTIDTLNSKIEEQQNIIDQLEKDKQQCEDNSNKARSDYEALQVLQNETQKEVEGLREALLSKKDDEIVRKQKKCINKLKLEGTSLQKTIDSLQNENEKLKIEREKYSKACDDLHFSGDKLKDALASANKENSQLKEEIKELKNDIEKNKKTVDDFVSPTSFLNHDLPHDLREKIGKVVDNNVLSANTKISHTISLIMEYFSKKMSELRNEYKAQITEKQQIIHSFSTFVVNLSLALDMEPNKFDINSNESLSALVEEVKKVKTQLNDVLRQNREQALSIKEINNAIQTTSSSSGPNVVNEMETLNKQISNLSSKLEKQKKRSQKVKSLLLKERKKNEAEKAQLSKDLNDQRQSFNNLLEENKRIKGQYDDVRTELAQVKSDNKDLHQKIQEIEKQHEEEIENIQSKFSSEKNNYEAQLQNQIELNNKHIENQAFSQRDHESIIHALNNTIETQKKIIETKNDENQRQIKDSEKKFKKMKERYEQEKNQYVESYSKTIKELQGQCEKHRTDLTTLSGDLAKSKKRNEKLSRQNKKLQLSICEMKLDIEKLKDAKERDNTLHDFSSKAALAALENKHIEQLNELRRKQEIEKMKIYKIAADEMRQFFNINESIDENQFRRVIKQANEEIHKLRENESAIRRMLSSGPSESTTEAVAQLILRK